MKEGLEMLASWNATDRYLLSVLEAGPVIISCINESKSGIYYMLLHKPVP